VVVLSCLTLDSISFIQWAISLMILLLSFIFNYSRYSKYSLHIPLNILFSPAQLPSALQFELGNKFPTALGPECTCRKIPSCISWHSRCYSLCSISIPASLHPEQACNYQYFCIVFLFVAEASLFP